MGAGQVQKKCSNSPLKREEMMKKVNSLIHQISEAKAMKNISKACASTVKTDLIAFYPDPKAESGTVKNTDK